MTSLSRMPSKTGFDFGKAASALGLLGGAGLAGAGSLYAAQQAGNWLTDSKANQGNNKMARIDQFNDEELMQEANRRAQMNNPANAQMPNPQDGTAAAINGMSADGSAYRPDSMLNVSQQAQTNSMLDDLEARQRRMGTYNLNNQMQKANFDNQYLASENMLNRYIQMRQTGANVLMNAAGQRY